MYASYLIEILNDKEMGNEQLVKAKEAAIQRINFDFNNLHEDASDMSTYAADGSPCVYISGEQDRLGVITQCNLSACRVFGYTKREEVVNHEVEILMPKIYGKYHKKFLEQAIQKPPDLLSNKERQVFGKHYSGHIFPIWLSIKNLPSFLSGRQFVATFKLEKSGINKNVAHLILDKNKEVIDASSTCLSMLDIDLAKFQKMKAKLDISLLLPSLFGANYYQFINKTGCQIEFQYPSMAEMDKKEEDADKQPDEDVKPAGYNVSLVEEEEDGLLSGEEDAASPGRLGKKAYLKNFMDGQVIEEAEEDKEEEDGEDEEEDKEEKGGISQFNYKIVASNKTANFQCNMIEIHFETQNLENPNPGYYIRLETLQDKQTGVAKIQKTLKQGAFQFSYDHITKRFNRELRDKENKEILIDKNYLALKKLKEGYVAQQKQNPAFVVPPKIGALSYMTYLNKY